jgi:hypothetical protein
MDKTGKVNPAFKKVRERKAALGQAGQQKDKSASSEEHPDRKTGKQRRGRDKLLQSWERQPNESSREWFGRLNAVQDKDKIDLKREFEGIKEKAWRYSKFQIDDQVYAIACLLIRHRDRYWPEEFRSHFEDIIRKAAAFADTTEEELHATLGDVGE